VAPGATTPFPWESAVNERSNDGSATPSVPRQQCVIPSMCLPTNFSRCGSLRSSERSTRVSTPGWEIWCKKPLTASSRPRTVRMGWPSRARPRPPSPWETKRRIPGIPQEPHRGQIRLSPPRRAATVRTDDVWIIRSFAFAPAMSSSKLLAMELQGRRNEHP
jgi:hypothetical protein